MAQYYDSVKYALLYLKVQICFLRFCVDKSKKIHLWIICIPVKDENLSDFKWRVHIFKCIYPCAQGSFLSLFFYLKNEMWNSHHEVILIMKLSLKLGLHSLLL